MSLAIGSEDPQSEADCQVSPAAVYFRNYLETTLSFLVSKGSLSMVDRLLLVESGRAVIVPLYHGMNAFPRNRLITRYLEPHRKSNLRLGPVPGVLYPAWRRGVTR
jgi:hypothetical protein